MTGQGEKSAGTVRQDAVPDKASPAPAEMPRAAGRSHARETAGNREDLAQPNGKKEGGASFGSLRLGAENIRPQIMSGNASDTLNEKYARGRHFLPLQNGSRCNAKATSQLARAADAVNCSLECGEVRVHAYL